MNILEVFFENPSKEYCVREIARKTKVAPATASKVLKELSKNKLLQKRTEHRCDLYRSNIEEEKYRDMKRFYMIQKIKNSGLIDDLNEKYLRPAIILFGSTSKGRDHEKSDIDLVIIANVPKDFDELRKYERILRKEIQLFIVKNINDLRNEHLINNVLNGTILQGTVKWISETVSGKDISNDVK